MKRLITVLLITTLLMLSLVGCGGNSATTSYDINQKYAVGAKGLNAVNSGSNYYYLDAIAASVASPTQAAASSNEVNWVGPDNEGWYTAEAAGITLRFRYLSSIKTYELSTEMNMEYPDLGMAITMKSLFSGIQGPDNLWQGNMTITTNEVIDNENSLTTTRFAFSGVDETYGCGTYDGWYSQSGTAVPLPVEDHQYLHLTATYNASTNMVHLMGWYSNMVTVSSQQTSFDKFVSPHRAN